MSTTLVTFHVSVPRTSVAFVQLLGSWDNFTKPYTLERDRKVGKTAWRACPSFTNVICDGERIDAEPRDGGLRMGSTYWYFYMIDNDDEFTDQAKPTTRDCPFLPGQEVNVLEVPTMLTARRTSNVSTKSSTEYTLNPEDKFAPILTRDEIAALSKRPNAPPPSPQTPRCVNPIADLGGTLLGRPETVTSSKTIATLHPTATFVRSASSGQDTEEQLCRLCSFYSVDAQPTRSDRPQSSWRPATQPTYSKRLSWLSWVPARNLWSAGDFHRVQSWPCRPSSLTQGEPQSMDVSARPQAMVHLPAQTNNAAPVLCLGLESQKAPSLHGVQDIPVTKHFKKLSLGLQNDLTLESTFDLGFEGEKDALMSTLQQPMDYNCAQPGDSCWPTSEVFEGIPDYLVEGAQSQLRKTDSTHSSTFFSSSKSTSALFSQPMTPLQTEFSIDFSQFGVPSMDPEPASNQVYSLEPSENASALTLHTLRALPDDSATTPTTRNFGGAKPTNRRVEEWVDRSKTTLEELREDMGYLCSLIE